MERHEKGHRDWLSIPNICLMFPLSLFHFTLIKNVYEKSVQLNKAKQIHIVRFIQLNKLRYLYIIKLTIPRLFGYLKPNTT